MADCINLKTRYGKIHRVAVDPSYWAETGATVNHCNDPWLYILKGSRGHVCPWGGELLAVCLNEGQKKLCTLLSKEPWVLSKQHGDDEINAVFHVKDFDKAAKYANLYRRRQYTPEELKAAQERARQNLHKEKA